MSDIRGRLLWLDLYTTDLAAARAYYTQVCGWTLTPFGPDYPMFTGARKPVGGSMLLPEQAKAMGAPPHWLAYFGTPDVDASVAQIKALGGQVYAAPFDVPSVGRVAVVSDPEGAVFGLYAPLDLRGDPDSAPEAGEVVWSELMAADWEGAWRFYEAVMGWTHYGSMDMGPMGTYWLFTAGPRPGIGGMMKKPEAMPQAAWLHYIAVDDLDAALERAVAAGGTIGFGPMEVPGGMRVAQCIDPQGAWFALHGK